jgi:hypothetical protein
MTIFIKNARPASLPGRAFQRKIGQPPPTHSLFFYIVVYVNGLAAFHFMHNCKNQAKRPDQTAKRFTG